MQQYFNRDNIFLSIPEKEDFYRLLSVLEMLRTVPNIMLSILCMDLKIKDCQFNSIKKAGPFLTLPKAIPPPK
jgi:hypothetical protein